jgi:uncharacterized tellurite resistance protein B-like protein
MPPERARLAAAAAYTIARAANADLEISDEETAVMEQALQGDERLDEPTAILVTEMAKLQAKTVGATEDYVVTRELKHLTTMEQRLAVLQACFAVTAADGTISAVESAIVNEIANELDIDAESLMPSGPSTRPAVVGAGRAQGGWSGLIPGRHVRRATNQPAPASSQRRT